MEKFSWWKWAGGFLVISLFVEGFFIFWNHYHHIYPATEAAAWGGEALTGLAAFLILIGFVYERYRSKNDSALEEVRFFLEECGPLFSKITLMVRERYPDKKPLDFLEIMPAIEKIENFSFDWVAEHASLQLKSQNDFQGDPQNGKIIEEVQNLLNHLEYLALHIKEKGTIKEPALISIRQGFVRAIETHLLTLLTAMIDTSDNFQNIRWLYFKWSTSIERLTLEQKKENLQTALRAGLKRAAASASGNGGLSDHRNI